VTSVLRGDRSHLDGVAQLWAEATAARDGDPDVAALEVSRPVLARVLDRPGAVLVVAVDEDEQVIAFAVAEPMPGHRGPGAAAVAADVRYVGVRPGRWGAGLGSGVMRFLAAELAAAGFVDAQLLVYADNEKAVRLYERLGWRLRGPQAPHPRTGRPEQRYYLRLAGVDRAS
jgi:ribosomal protein S18 acetylase RimI-like enzyme